MTIPLFTVFMPKDVDSPLLNTLHSGYIGQGAQVKEFESKLGERFCNENALTLNSATSGLQLALRLANVGPGDEVISTPMTCTASNMPILAAGAKIVWADISPQTGLIDPLDIERKINGKTKAILCVDWGGMPCDYDAIMDIANRYRYGIKVIQDSAHAIGSQYRGRIVGTIADYTVFSFQAIKHISTVDGGVLFCKSSSDYHRGKLLRWYGIDREGERRDFRCEEDILEWGYKFHMNDINATIGIAALSHLDSIVGQHRSHALYYSDVINPSYYILPDERDMPYQAESSYWLYTIQLPNEKSRVSFMQFMKDNDVMVSQVHARNDTHSAFAPFRCNLPGVNQFVDRQVSIPVHWNLGDPELKKIADLCNRFAERK